MEIRLSISGFGIGLANTGFGVNAVSGCYVEIRENWGASTRVYGVTDHLSLGSDSSTILVGHVSTEWMKIKEGKPRELLKHTNLVGKLSDITVSGTTIGSSNADVTVKVVDDTGTPVTVIDKMGIKASGFQISSTKIRGKLKSLITKQQLEAVKGK